MPQTQLDNLVRIGKLKIEVAGTAEVEGLIRSGKARLKDAANGALSIDSRFDLAYSNALLSERLLQIADQIIRVLQPARHS